MDAQRRQAGDEPGDQADRRAAPIVTALNSLGSAWIFALMVLINADVFSRFLFNFPIQGVTELVELSIVGIVFLQAGDAVRMGRLTRSDGLFSKLVQRRPVIGHSLGALFDLAGAVFFIAILLGAVPRLVEAYERGYFAGNEGIFVVPVWPVRLILVIGCIVIVSQFLMRAKRHIVDCRALGRAPL